MRLKPEQLKFQQQRTNKKAYNLLKALDDFSMALPRLCPNTQLSVILMLLALQLYATYHCALGFDTWGRYHTHHCVLWREMRLVLTCSKFYSSFLRVSLIFCSGYPSGKYWTWEDCHPLLHILEMEWVTEDFFFLNLEFLIPQADFQLLRVQFRQDQEFQWIAAGFWRDVWGWEVLLGVSLFVLNVTAVK